MAIRVGLLKEVVVMALDTVRGNKMRSALTVLGVVIGITSIVGMTALVRGFDESIKDLLRTVGPTAITVTRFSIANIAAGGTERRELLKRPHLTISDARALETQSTTAQIVDIELGAGIGPRTAQRVFYRDQKTKQLLVLGTGERFAEGSLLPFIAGRYFNGVEVQYRKNVVVLGNTPYKLLFEPSGTDPIGKLVRVGNERFEVVGVLGPRSSAGLGGNVDDFVAIPYTAYQRIYGLRMVNVGLGTLSNIQFTVLPHEGISQKEALDDLRRVMRTRHGLKLDQPDDFDLGTQDSLMQLYNSISQATFFALVVISSIALMVGGIGVMAIMSITVTERTREIGVRKALGARRVEILFQFLMEAAVLTSVGGILGIALGSLIGLSVHWISGFPISLPWWSFAMGLGFSASVGIFFGMYPAFKASRLDPIEALRYE